MQIVGHMDILGMSELVRRNFDDAWGMLSDLVDVRDHAQRHEYEFVETQERLSVFERIHIVTFSDTLLVFTAGSSPLELKSMVVLMAEIFHKALCRCVPIRAGLAMGELGFNFKRSMFAGPALIEAYEVGESAQWLGIAIAPSLEELALAQRMRSQNRNVVVRWAVPTKDGSRDGYAVNWPGIFAHDLTKTPPISVDDFYSAFSASFGDFGSLPLGARAKYENTVAFMNSQLTDETVESIVGMAKAER